MNASHNHVSITGGTGHLGTCLIQLLLHKGFKVKALFNSTLPTINHKNITWIKGSILNVDSLDELMHNTSVIIHCASIISLGNQNRKKVFDCNVRGTENIVETCLKSKVRLVFISSIAAVKESIENESFSENAPYKTESDFLYGWTKALAEQNILMHVDNSSLNAIIIRPTAIVGPPDNVPSYFGTTIFDMQTGNLPIITTGGYNVVDVRDLSVTIINSLDRGRIGEIYLVGGNYISIKKLSQLANPNWNVICFPIAVLISILPLVKLYEKLFPLKWPITKESLVTLKRAPKNVDSSKAIKELGHKIRPTIETIQDLLEWFKVNHN